MEKEARKLRQSIQAHRIARLNWSDTELYNVMEGLGFGRSLRALPVHRLSQLYKIISDYRPPRDDAFEYDKVGKYMYALQRQAELSDSFLRYYWTYHFRKTHWNVLSGEEKYKTIAMLEQAIHGEKQ